MDGISKVAKKGRKGKNFMAKAKTHELYYLRSFKTIQMLADEDNINFLV